MVNVRPVPSSIPPIWSDHTPMSISSRRQRERQERRASILDAAEAVFAAKGFAQATMDDIAAEAQLSKGTLYLYFKNKDDLLLALASRSVETAVEELERVAGSALGGTDAIRAMLGYQARHILDRPRMFRMMIAQISGEHEVDASVPSFERHRALVSRITAAFAGVIERGQRDGSLRADIEPMQTSVQLWGGLVGTMLLRLNRDRLMCRVAPHADFDKLVAGYIDLVCHGLQSANAESSS